MLLHGEKDTDVPFGQSLAMSDALSSKGVKHELILDSEWGHGFYFPTKSSAKLDKAIAKVIMFLDKHL